MRYKKIPKEFFTKNRNDIVKKLRPNSVALLFGAYQMPRNGDQFFTYRQSSDFFYLTGIEQEKSVLLLTNKSGQAEAQQILFIIKPNKNLEIWEGHKLTLEEARDISGIETVKFVDNFEMVLHSHLCEVDNIYFNFLELPKFKPEVKLPDYEQIEKIRDRYPAHYYHRLAPHLQELRLIKSESEIELIKKSCSITNDAFKRVLRAVGPKKYEYEIEAEVNYEFTRQGASGHGYFPIIAGGKNGCILHYVENNQKLQDGDLLLMDFGAEYGNYSADLSRTIPVNGLFSKRQKECYGATLEVFKFARSLMKPGATINDIQKEVCKRWEEEHLRLGLYTKKDVKNHKGETPLWFNYYMHGIGHFIGLDVHDVGSRDVKLRPGMVLTCEPGLYIAEEGIGIRIENDILITEDGNVDLMQDIPIEINEIEGIMKSK